MHQLPLQWDLLIVSSYKNEELETKITHQRHRFNFHIFTLSISSNFLCNAIGLTDLLCAVGTGDATVAASPNKNILSKIG